jgi:hypothetical protein
MPPHPTLACLPADICLPLVQNVTSYDFGCVAASNAAKNKILGIIFLVINCGSMAVYVLLQKRFVFDKSPECKLDPHDLGRWTAYPITVTAYRCGDDRGRGEAAKRKEWKCSTSFYFNVPSILILQLLFWGHIHGGDGRRPLCDRPGRVKICYSGKDVWRPGICGSRVIRPLLYVMASATSRDV